MGGAISAEAALAAAWNFPEREVHAAALNMMKEHQREHAARATDTLQPGLAPNMMNFAYVTLPRLQ